MAEISQIKLPNNDIYDIRDSGALPLTGGQVTGPVTFGDTVTADDLNVGTFVITGNASFTNNISANTINGVAVGSAPKFTDTNTTYTAGTGLSLSGTTFNHSNSITAQTTQALYPIKIDAQGHISGYGTAVTSAAAESGGTTLSLVTTGEKYTWNSKTSNIGTITSVKTTAGAHAAINITSGAVSFNVPTTAEHVGAVPTTRKVNGYPLTSDILINTSDIPYYENENLMLDDVLDSKVDKVSGKGLSTNDYTTAEKTKLAGIAEGAEKNRTYTAVTGKPTANQTPSFGGTFTISQITQSTTGQITATDRTVQIPNNTATHTSAGLMSASDKEAIDDFIDFTPSLTYEQGTRKLTLLIETPNETVKTEDIVTFPEASTSVAGFMSTTDKTKLNKLVFDSGNKIDSSILPSYVDDVIEAYARSGQTALSSTWLATGSATGTVITPEAGKIYVLMADSGDYSANTQFRWGGTAYVKMNDGGVSAITNDEINAICV